MKKYLFIFFFMFIFSTKAEFNIAMKVGPYFDSTKLVLKKVKHTEEFYYIYSDSTYNDDVYRAYDIFGNTTVWYYNFHTNPLFYDYYGKDTRKRYKAYGIYMSGEGIFDKWLSFGFESNFANGNKKKDKYSSSMFELYTRLILFSSYKFNIHIGVSGGIKYINFNRLYKDYEKLEDIDLDGVLDTVFYNYYMKAHASYFYESFMLGFIYNFTDNISIDFTYKYLPKKTIEFDNDNVQTLQALKNMYEGDYEFDIYASTLSLGIRYIF